MLKLFSADDHIIEHASVWQDRVPTKHRDAAPRVIEEDGREYWLYEDTRGETMGLNAVVGRPRDQLKPDPIRFSEMRSGCYDPASGPRTCCPTASSPPCCSPRCRASPARCSSTFKDKALADVCVKAYNDFVIDEWCPAGPPGLFVPTVLCQLWDPELAAAEIHRCADKGARALSFPENAVPVGLPSYWDPYWNPIWRAAEERDIVLCLHIGTSGQIPVPSPDAPDALELRPAAGRLDAVVGEPDDEPGVPDVPRPQVRVLRGRHRLAAQRAGAGRPDVVAAQGLQRLRRHPARRTSSARTCTCA